MDRTEKDDWLNDWFAEKPNTFVSGHKNFSKSLSLSDESIVSIRFISLRKEFLWFLVVESKEEHWWEITTTLSTNNKVLSYISSFFNGELNILLFSPDSTGRFLYKRYDSTSYSKLNTTDLQSVLNQELPSINKNLGTVKEENKSINDYFQLWTRTYLSKYCVVNDFDAIHLSGDDKSRIYELKRFQEDIGTWEPFLDDLRNYHRLDEISSLLKIKNLLIAYNAYNDKMFALHKIQKANEIRICGECTLVDVEKSKTLKNTYRKYVSKRRRQNNY